MTSSDRSDRGDHIRNPLEWSADQLRAANQALGHTGQALGGSEEAGASTIPAVRRIKVDDLRDVLAKGLDDFGTYRTDIFFLCIIYPIAGLVLTRLAFGYDFLPLLFPLASGFALIGPLAAVGLYEMSKQRERGAVITWADAFGVVRSPAFGAIVVMGLILVAIFLVWLATAQGLYWVTLGPEPPASLGAFASEVFTTRAGWAMMLFGMGIGFLFAVLVLSISVVSFPMLLDRDVGLYRAIATSIRAVTENPKPMAAWGLIVAGGLLVGSIPALLGLVIVMPVLGHATWHLYRALVPR